ncbi:MAG: STAS domain-containing protein [Magnetococcales bacterium]|nr:STAS domain-containing protein [Magnetococcales bacterium]
MSGTMSVLRFDKRTTIKISGYFDYNLLTQFQDVYKDETDDTVRGRCFIIDLSGTRYIDSSALGMLNILRTLIDIPGGNEGASIEIVNTCPEIRKILETANFDRIFKII